MLRAPMADPEHDADEPRDDESAAERPDEASAEAHAEQAPGAAKRPRKNKKKKGKKAEDAPKPIPGAGTPDGDKLREALRAFEVGDYARVRARARDLEGASDPAVREAAAELAARISVDPVQIVVIGACAAVLAAIAYVWIF